jgi:hypothetical protein
MSGYTKPDDGPRREQFPDGSALVTYADGTMLIVESTLAKATPLREGRPVNYHEPPPPPAASWS